MDVKVTVKFDVVPDDGLPGIFWRDCERWDRQSDGSEYRLLDVAPNLEAKFMQEQLLVEGIVDRLREKQGLKQ